MNDEKRARLETHGWRVGSAAELLEPPGAAMAQRISITETRRRIGDMLNRVAVRRDEFIIERRGRAFAALVPVERLDQMRRFARRHALDVMKQQSGGALTDDQAMALGLEAQRTVRRHTRKLALREK